MDMDIRYIYIFNQTSQNLNHHIHTGPTTACLYFQTAMQIKVLNHLLLEVTVFLLQGVTYFLFVVLARAKKDEI